MVRTVFLSLSLLLSVVGCAVTSEFLGPEIIVNHEEQKIYVEVGDKISIQLKKRIPIGSAEAKSLRLIVTESTINNIEGEIISGAGICISPKGKKFNCYSIKDIEGQVARVKTENIKSISVFTTKTVSDEGKIDYYTEIFAWMLVLLALLAGMIGA